QGAGRSGQRGDPADGVAEADSAQGRQEEGEEQVLAHDVTELRVSGRSVMTSSNPIDSSTGTGWLMLAHRNHHHDRYRTLLVLLGALCAVLCLVPAAQAAG